MKCKSCGLIYLLQCQICHLQHVGKSKTAFKLQPSNHREDSKAKNSILACMHFQASNHNFQRDTKFTMIEETSETSYNGTATTYSEKEQESFWILKLKTLHLGGLNQELNDV